MALQLNNYALGFDEQAILEAVVEKLQERAPCGWLPYRVIFRNFWFFVAETFLILHGRLFLGGQNSAGKSTVLSMCITYLLDGDKSEERLNTFGGKGRHMAYYVTGTSDLSEVGQDATALYSFPFRTSYVALEFRRVNAQGEPEYLTIGQGLSHNREAKAKDVSAWGFVLEGRRIGIRDGAGLFDVVHPETGVSLSRGELKRLIEADAPGFRCGKVFDSNRDYRSEVNARLFGFADVTDYDNMVDMLLRIRRPKLSLDGKPSVVADFLSKSHPRLSPEVMATTAASLAHIDQTVENIGLLEDQIRAASDLDRDLQTVFRLAALSEAARYQAAQQAADSARQELEAAGLQIDQASASIAELEREQVRRSQNEAAIASESTLLRSHDAARAHTELPAVRQQLGQANQEVASKHREKRLLAGELERSRSEEAQAASSWEKGRDTLFDEIEQFTEVAGRSRWPLAGHWSASLQLSPATLTLDSDHLRIAASLPRGTAARLAEDQVEAIRAYDQLLAASQQAEQAWTSARTAEQEAGAQFRKFDARRAHFSGLFEDQRRLTLEQVEDALAACRCVTVPSAAAAGALAALAAYTYQPSVSPSTCLQGARPLYDMAEAACNQEEVVARQALAETERVLALLRAEMNALRDALPEPPRSETRAAARRLLAAHGIPAAPLYETLMPAPDAAPAAVGLYEQSLLDTGLLDALVIPDGSGAATLLQAHGLADAWLAPAPAAATESALPVCADPDHPLAASASLVLAAIAAGSPLRVDPDGCWHHGLAAGVALSAVPSRFLGRSARERYRQEQQRKLEETMALAEARRMAPLDSLQQIEQRRRDLCAEWQGLLALPGFTDLQTLGAEVDTLRSTTQLLREQLEELSIKTEEARDRHEATQIPLQQALAHHPEFGGLDRNGLNDLVAATREVAGAIRAIHSQVEILRVHRQNVLRLREHQRMEQARIETLAEAVERVDLQISDLEGRERALQRLVDTPHARAILDRIETIEQERAQLARDQREGLLALGAMTDRLARLQQAQPGLTEEVTRTWSRAEDLRRKFRSALSAYPSLASTYAEQLASSDPSPAPLLQAAAHLLTRREERPNLVDEIEEDLRKANSTLSRTYANTEGRLGPFHPNYHPEERTDRLVRCQLDGVSLTPHSLLLRLHEMAQGLRDVLSDAEAALFGKHIMRELGREVRQKLMKANDWVREMNAILSRHPMANGEHVELVWEPKKSSRNEPGGLIAQHINLLWIDDDHRTPVQRDTLRSAFEAEVNLIREQARKLEWRPDVFRQKLEEVLDYRTWFQFRIYVTGGVDGRQEITDAKQNAGSGAERSLVPLLALLAGLSSAYRGARPEAPRLVALDEAFAGLDPKNGLVLIRALIDLGFAWIISSPERPPFTVDLPGAAFYLMLRDGMDTGARALIWNGNRVIDDSNAWEALTDAS